MSSILLVARHGQTQANRLGVLQGLLDNELALLDQEGLEQARRLADFCQMSYNLSQIVSSPLTRARQTAEVVSSLTGAGVVLDPALSECCYGSWEGRAKCELKQERPQEWAERENNKLGFVHPGWYSRGDGSDISGESYEWVFQRYDRRLSEWWGAAQNLDCCLLIVAHLGVTRFALHRWFELSIEQVMRCTPGPTKILEFRGSPDQWDSRIIEI